jgi:hypothetical protein
MEHAVDWAIEKKQWRLALAELFDSIAQWAEAEGWLVARKHKEISESKLGTYEAGELLVRTPNGHLVVEPIGRDIVGAEGRVDISSFPLLNRMLLVRVGDGWRLKTDGGVTWPKSWGREAFVELAALLTSEE